MTTIGSTKLLSDKSVSGDYKRAQITSRTKGWKDLDLSLTLHPVRKDIMPLRDDNAIKNSIRNLLVSNFYERPFSKDKGANLRALLFEPADMITKISLRKNITRVIQKYEPRVLIESIDIRDVTDVNSYKITVNFKIKEYDTNTAVEIVLRRLR